MSSPRINVQSESRYGSAKKKELSFSRFSLVFVFHLVRTPEENEKIRPVVIDSLKNQQGVFFKKNI